MKTDKMMSDKPKMVTACCESEIDCTGGGYDGEDIIPVVCFCKKCQKTEPKMKQKGRGSFPKILLKRHFNSQPTK